MLYKEFMVKCLTFAALRGNQYDYYQLVVRRIKEFIINLKNPVFKLAQLLEL
jgi:hypothetical protein